MPELPRPSPVIKLGGSLLDLPDLPARLGEFLCTQGGERPLLLPGGGSAVDLLRRHDRDFGIGEEASHYLALQQLSIHARLLEHLGIGLRYARTAAEYASIWSAGEVPVCDAYRFIRDVDETSEDPMPRAWHVTSDAIAARLAVLLGGDEVVLLKSVGIPIGTTAQVAADRGFVDAFFPAAARGLARISVVDLRNAPGVRTTLAPATAPVDSAAGFRARTSVGSRGVKDTRRSAT